MPAHNGPSLWGSDLWKVWDTKRFMHGASHFISQEAPCQSVQINEVIDGRNAEEVVNLSQCQIIRGYALVYPTGVLWPICLLWFPLNFISYTIIGVKWNADKRWRICETDKTNSPPRPGTTVIGVAKSSREPDLSRRLGEGALGNRNNFQNRSGKTQNKLTLSDHQSVVMLVSKLK